MRYTDLSERTVRTALDRLEAESIIQPCDPAVVAAKIKRADHRPQGWDLAMQVVRDDLDDEELSVLERQFPGLTARVTAMRTTDSRRRCGPDDWVQQLHPNRPLNHPGNRPPPAQARATSALVLRMTDRGRAAVPGSSSPGSGRIGP